MRLLQEPLYNDDLPGTLFHDPENTNKKIEIRNLLTENILNGKIRTNIDGFKMALRNGCKPKLFGEIIQELEKSVIIERTGNVNNRCTSIHRLEQNPYFIKVLKK